MRLLWLLLLQLVQHTLWAMTGLAESLLCWHKAAECLSAEHLYSGQEAAALQKCRAHAFQVWLQPAHQMQLELLGAAKAVASATAHLLLHPTADNRALLQEQVGGCVYKLSSYLSLRG